MTYIDINLMIPLENKFITKSICVLKKGWEQECKARKVNCGRVYSALHPWVGGGYGV